ncbi:MAG: efflux RND transporter periplasmic adaptor subunit [Proteobacteria bacterium]|nr:efflux RND transporter periplasmic adaptor subunit [Pseudomonadota bacterium]MBU4385079.1 efflux RND transporter periplasmic adaptor subunit [Pseudomonadota bacterium]MBU4604430.1 efflux RND transporter periplasmic adaptor subunit [Pseudomonadota bacterium]MCG2763201.1 efflux RND transporter periplasmic adaptor subunit [Desulfarculaceae bacterium]
MRVLKPIVIGVVLLALVAVGWIVRGLVPDEQAAGSKGVASVAPRGGAPEVVTAVLKETSLKPPNKYVGHVEAIQGAEIYAQVEGIIKTVHFKEGAMVNQGDLLFTIDPDRYQAKVELNEATLAQTKASLTASQANLESVAAQRTYAEQYLKRLSNAGARSVVQADVDKAKSAVRQYNAAQQEAQAKVEQLKAQVKQSEANLKVARIDLAYTQVRSPITGRIGKAEVTAGAYVSPGAVMMARVVQVDPVRVRFAISDRDYLDLLKISKREGIEAIKARLVLPNGDAFKGEGALDFVGNRMNLNTGTIVIRLRYDNSGGELVPNSYVKVLMETPNTARSVVLPQEAVMTDQKGEYVYVVSAKGVAQQRYVKLGDSVDGNRIVNSGVKAGETVVVQGLQRVRPGQPVKAAKTGPGADREDRQS